MLFAAIPVLLYLRSLSHLALDDLDDDDAQAKTVLNYIHAIHMEVCACGCMLVRGRCC